MDTVARMGVELLPLFIRQHSEMCESKLVCAIPHHDFPGGGRPIFVFGVMKKLSLANA